MFTFNNHDNSHKLNGVQVRKTEAEEPEVSHGL